MSDLSRGVHIDLDGAVASAALRLGLPTVDTPEWGPELRYCAPTRRMTDFLDLVRPDLEPFILTGSGDFHHLTALWLREAEEPFVLFAFDNHPDWDIRPPRWSCGGWINRALENPHLQRVVVWGCGNFELRFPSRMFANRAALRSGRLEVRPWAERLGDPDRRRYRCLSRSNWREEFEKEVERTGNSRVYVSIDLDCLSEDWGGSNWENGRYEPDDLVWALQLLHARATVAGGDLCGAFSAPRYARVWQRLLAGIDHPRLASSAIKKTIETTNDTIVKIWPALVG